MRYAVEQFFSHYTHIPPLDAEPSFCGLRFAERGARSASTNAPQTTDTAPRAPQTMLAAPLSLAYAPDIYAVAPPHRDARNLTAANAFRAGADTCTPNADHGCLDGTPYDLSLIHI